MTFLTLVFWNAKMREFWRGRGVNNWVLSKMREFLREEEGVLREKRGKREGFEGGGRLQREEKPLE